MSNYETKTQYVAEDLFDNSVIGPFPSQCQAMSYTEHANERRKSWEAQYRVKKLYAPSFMPLKIHG